MENQKKEERGYDQGYKEMKANEVFQQANETRLKKEGKNKNENEEYD